MTIKLTKGKSVNEVVGKTKSLVPTYMHSVDAKFMERVRTIIELILNAPKDVAGLLGAFLFILVRQRQPFTLTDVKDHEATESAWTVHQKASAIREIFGIPQDFIMPYVMTGDCQACYDARQERVNTRDTARKSMYGDAEAYFRSRINQAVGFMCRPTVNGEVPLATFKWNALYGMDVDWIDNKPYIPDYNEELPDGIDTTDLLMIGVNTNVISFDNKKVLETPSGYAPWDKGLRDELKKMKKEQENVEEDQKA